MKVRVEKRFAFSAVPDALLEDKRLSLSARTVLGWMLGRPPGWKISLEHMKSVLGVSDKVWPRIRDELANAGYYQQDRQRGVSKRGKKGVPVPRRRGKRLRFKPLQSHFRPGPPRRWHPSISPRCVSNSSGVLYEQ